MASHPYRHTAYSSATRWLAVGFVAGAVSVLVFHQGAFALLHAAGFTPVAPYSVKPTSPWGLPAIWSISFWGGLWGIVMAAFMRGLARRPAALIVASTAFGAFALSLVAWFVVDPIKGLRLAAGAVPMAMAVAMIVNGAWGFGTGAGLAVFGVSREVRSRGDPSHGARAAAG